MRKLTRLIILLLLTLGACLEDIEPNINSFVKMYGDNLDTGLWRFLPRPENNGFILFGRSFKNIQQSGYSVSVGMPTIIVTDELGNEVFSRQYQFEEFEYKNNQGRGLKWDITNAEIWSMVPLSNGNYFATISLLSFNEEILSTITSGGSAHIASHYLILDQNFNMIKHGLFNDDSSYVDRIRFYPVAYNIPNSNEVLVLMKRTRNFVPGSLNQDFSTHHYSLYKLNQDGDILWVRSLDQKYNTLGNDITFDDNNNIVVAGWDFSGTCLQNFADVIDVNEGNLINSYDLGENGIWSLPVSIQKTTNGYVIQDFSADCQKYDADLRPDVQNATGSLWFLDNNFNILKKQIVAPGIVNWSWINIIQASDGGYILGFTEPTSSDEATKSALVIKTDSNGIVEWTYSERRAHMGETIYETPDEGFVFSVVKNDINTQTSKGYLIKLNKHGQLD